MKLFGWQHNGAVALITIGEEVRLYKGAASVSAADGELTDEELHRALIDAYPFEGEVTHDQLVALQKVSKRSRQA